VTWWTSGGGSGALGRIQKGGFRYEKPETGVGRAPISRYEYWMRGGDNRCNRYVDGLNALDSLRFALLIDLQCARQVSDGVLSSRKTPETGVDSAKNNKEVDAIDCRLDYC